MASSELNLVLILSDRPQVAAVWEAALSAAGARVVRSARNLSDGGALDVIVADRPFAPNELGLAERRWRDGDLGVVAIGIELPAHASLPADATTREVLLAARMATQIGRLTARLRQGRRRRKQLLQLAMRDPLTGLPNRRAWEQELVARWPTIVAGGEAALAVLDVDGFKAINDQQGHVVGDEVLKSFAAGLEASVRDDDFVARLGGDEFGVLLANLPQSGVDRVVNRIRQEGAETIMMRDGANRPLVVTASAGWTWLPGEGTAEEAFRRADQALLAAKSAGRDRTVSGGG